MSAPPNAVQYNDDFNTLLQHMWGDGFLSPGGAEEVGQMLRDVPLEGRSVLEVGSGLGAAAVLLVERYGAASVTGIDVEAHLIDQSTKRAHDAGLGDRVRFRLVEPGPLPFADASFDLLFSKDAIVHIPDKAAFYADALRVLKPGGYFVGSDWLRGDDKTFTPRAKDWLEFVHLDFRMQDLEATAQAMEAAGFGQVRLDDRNEWYRKEIANELASLSGDRFTELTALVGEEQAAYRVDSSKRKRDAIEDGFLRPTHIVAVKPGT